MKEYFRLCAKVGIVLFVIGHLCAVALYSIPHASRDPISQALRNNILPRVMPYVLVISQWQQWNLFSPNPLRRVIFYRLDRQIENDEWETVATIDDRAYGVWRHATRFKLFGQVFEEERDDLLPIREQAVRVLCREWAIEPGTRVRVWHLISVVPYIDPTPSREWWDKWTPTYEPSLAIETTCPTAP